MTKRRVSWGLIIVLALVGMVALVVGAGAFAYFRYVGVRTADATEAERSFEEISARFNHQEPRFVLDARDGVRLKKPIDPAARPAPFKALHVLAWNEDEGELVRVELPAWLVRWRANSGDFEVTLDNGESYTLDLKDLERIGPGLLLDHTQGRERAMIWLE